MTDLLLKPSSDSSGSFEWKADASCQLDLGERLATGWPLRHPIFAVFFFFFLVYYRT